MLVSTLPALLQRVPSPTSLEAGKQLLQCGKCVDLDQLRAWLIQAGYHATGSVQLPGEFALRGGILDIFAPDEALPVRVELFDNEIESLRSFDVVSQRSIEQRESLQLLAVHGTLHVLGLDHPEGRGRLTSAMWRRQERIVRRLRIEP